MRIDEYEEMLKEEEENSKNVFPIRNPARLLPASSYRDLDDYYRQQAARAARTPFNAPRNEEEPRSVIVVDEDSGHVGRMNLMRMRGSHLGAVELC